MALIRGTFCIWLREEDSNPHKQSQSLSCYLYTIPHRNSIIYYNKFTADVNTYLKI